METTQQTDDSPEFRQDKVDKLISTWKARKKQLEQESQLAMHTPEYQAALEELDKRRTARGSRQVKV